MIYYIYFGWKFVHPSDTKPNKNIIGEVIRWTNHTSTSEYGSYGYYYGEIEGKDLYRIWDYDGYVLDI